jgi:hypothetical protein
MSAPREKVGSLAYHKRRAIELYKRNQSGYSTHKRMRRFYLFASLSEKGPFKSAIINHLANKFRNYSPLDAAAAAAHAQA